MKWEKVKSLYKNQWVIIEAIEAHSKNSERILDEISVVDVTGDDSRKALEIYKKLHMEINILLRDKIYLIFHQV